MAATTARGRPEAGRGIIAPLALALAILAVLPYLHGIDNEFIMLDDPLYVTQNAQVQRGLSWDGAVWALTTFYEGNWDPLTWLSHMADVSLFGLAPWGHHLVSVLVHGLNAALLFLALFRLTGSPWPSAFASVLFGVHPLRVESVAWVAERKDLLAGLFFMLVLLAYGRYARRGGRSRLLAVAGLLALGLMAKPMLVTVPFVLLLLDLWPLGRTPLAAPADGGTWAPVPWRKLLLEKTPLLALACASLVITFLAQRAAGAVAGLAVLPLGVRVANAVVSYAGYLGKTIWPSGLAVLYPPPMRYPSPWALVGSLLVLGLLSWGVLARFRRLPVLAVGWLWFLGMLVPVIGLVQVGDHAMADRFTYLPLVGVFIAVAWGVPQLLPAWRGGAVALGAVGVAVVASLTWASWMQVSWWKDSETLFRRTLALTTDNSKIENNLGGVLLLRGAVDEAVGHFREALRIFPDYPEAHYNLAIALHSQGLLAEAAAEYREVLRLRPDFEPARQALGALVGPAGRP